MFSGPLLLSRTCRWSGRVFCQRGTLLRNQVSPAQCSSSQSKWLIYQAGLSRLTKITLIWWWVSLEISQCGPTELTLWAEFDVHWQSSRLPPQGVCSDPGSGLPYRAPRWRWSGCPGCQTWLWNARRRGASRRLQLQTPQEEEKLLFPWKRNNFLRPWGSSIWTVPARQFGNNKGTLIQPNFLTNLWIKDFILLTCTNFVLFRKAEVRPASVQGNPGQWRWLWWSTTQRSETEASSLSSYWPKACVWPFSSFLFKYKKFGSEKKVQSRVLEVANHVDKVGLILRSCSADSLLKADRPV